MNDFSFANHHEYYTSGVSNDIRRLQARYKVLIEENLRWIRDKTILDLGAHNGRWMLPAIKQGAKKVVGVESCDTWSSLIPTYLFNYDISIDKFEVHKTDVLSFLQQHYDRHFDTVFCFGLLYHVYYHVSIFRYLYKAPKPNCIIIDTEVKPGDRPAIIWETERAMDGNKPQHILDPNKGIVGFPTELWVKWILTEMGYKHVEKLPVATSLNNKGTEDYSRGLRVSYRGYDD
jgi:2-polyprenyl-3-methyl-5-hydroxy-6-metoxy-1,4-benzoquinol methylase